MTMTYAAARVSTRRVREDRGEQGNGEREGNTRRLLFSLGRLYATQGALSLLADIRDAGKPYSVQQAAQAADPMAQVLPLVLRHSTGDWGDVEREDWTANDEAIGNGGRLFSAYQLTAAARVWIITEADRSSTTVLLPEDY